MEENPFATTPLTEADDFKAYEGYEAERTELDKALKTEGVTILRSEAGYGKTTLARYYAFLGKAHYLKPALYEELSPRIKALRTKRFLLWQSEQPVKKPVFVDECGSLDERANALLKAELHDEKTKLILIFNHDEYNKLKARKQELTLLDCVVEEITLNGFSPADVEKIIQQKTNRFAPELVKALAESYTKPRDLFRVCAELWKQAGDKDKVTLDDLRQLQPKAQRQIVANAKHKLTPEQSKIYRFIQTHPASTFFVLKNQSFGVEETSLKVILGRMKKRGDITQNEQGQYFVSGLGV